MLKAVIFDMDGVLFDSESLWKKMFIEANEKYGLSLTEEYRQSICGKNEKVIRDELKKVVANLDVDEYREFIIKGVNSRIESGCFDVKCGVRDIISFLKERGCRTALATSSSRLRAENMFKAKNLNETDLFDAVVYGDEVGERSKPDPYIFEIAADKLGFENPECIVVEDSINGVKAAVDGGFIPVMLVDLIQPDAYCRENCRSIIYNLKDLMDIVESMI